MSIGLPIGRAGKERGSMVSRMVLGGQLRRFREAAGVTSEQAAYEIRASRAKISRMENGRSAFKTRDLADLLTLYGITDEEIRAEMASIAREANTRDWWSAYDDILPDWFETYLSLEEAASAVHSVELQFVHGLLQTEDYARAVMLLGRDAPSGEEAERRVRLRLQRQEVLSCSHPPKIWSVMDEAVLRRQVGSRAVMRAQVSHLAQVAERPGITVQVLPSGRGTHAAASGSFTLLHFAGTELPDIVYIEQLTSALYLDNGTDVSHYRDIFTEIRTETLPPDRTAAFLAEIAGEI